MSDLMKTSGLIEDRLTTSEKYNTLPAKVMRFSSRTFLFLIVCLVAIFMIAPFAWMIITSLKPKAETLLFMGCVPSYLDLKMIPSLLKPLDAAGVDYTTLANEEGCCGFPMFLMGAREEFTRNAERLMEMNVEDKTGTATFPPTILVRYIEAALKKDQNDIRNNISVSGIFLHTIGYIPEEFRVNNRHHFHNDIDEAEFFELSEFESED